MDINNNFYGQPSPISQPNAGSTSSLIEGQVIDESGQLAIENLSLSKRISLSRPKEDKFLELLLSIDDQKPTSATFHLLYEWLITYGTFAEQSELFTHMDFFYLFFSLLRKCSLSMRIEEMRRINRLLNNAPFIKIYIRASNLPGDYGDWIRRLMEDVLPDYLEDLQLEEDEDQQPLWIEFAAFLEILGSLHINEVELKSLFRFFKKSIKLKDRVWGLFIESMKKIASLPVGPDVYWNFPGYPDFSIVFPTIKFPTNGYTICMWVRIESFQHPQFKVGYVPHLLSFLSNDGSGIELFLVDGYLTVKTSASKKVETEKFKFQFQPGKWYFLAVTHEYHMITRSEVKLFVDNQKFGSTLSYPKIVEPLTLNTLGCNGKIANIYTSGRPQPFLGQIAGFYFFQEPLSDNDVRDISSISPKMFSNFNPGNVGSLGDPKLASKLLFAYSPKACKDELCVHVNGSIKLMGGNNGVLRGIKVVKVSTLKDTIRHIGGVKVLYPLLSELSNLSGGTQKLDESQFFLSNVVNASMITQLLSLLNELLKESPSNQEDIVECGGFQIIGYLLQQMPPQFFTKETVKVIDQLANSLSFNESLQRDLFLSIMCEFKIWVYANLQAQTELLLILKSAIASKPTYYRSFIGVQFWLDITRNFLWSIAEPNSLGRERTNSSGVALVEESENNNNGNPLPVTTVASFLSQKSRPSEKDMKIIRQTVFEIIYFYVKDNISIEETKSLLLYLIDYNDDRQIANVLQMILSLQTKAQHPITKHLMALGGIDPFIGLLECPSENVRIWTLKVIGRLIELSPSSKPKMTNETRLITMKKLIQGSKITLSLYYGLLEILLENISATNVAKPIDPNHVTLALSAQYTFNVAATCSPQYLFKNSGVLPVLFESVALSAIPDLQLQVLQDFVFLLRGSAQNRIVFLDQHNWQSWLLGILASVLHNQSILLKTRNDIYLSCMEIFTLLHHQCFYQIQVEGQGWSNFIQTETLVLYFSERGYFDAEKINRSLYDALLKNIQSDTKLWHYPQNASQAPSIELKLWENVIRFIGHLEKFLFANPRIDEGQKQEFSADVVYDFRIHRTQQGRWSDYQLGQQLLEFVEILIAKISSIPPTVQGQNSLLKHMDILLRCGLSICLVTIQEAVAYGNSEKVVAQSEQFKQLQNFVERERQRIKDATVAFIKAKVSQYSVENEQSVRTLERIFKKIHVLVAKLLTLSSDNDANRRRVLFLVTFIYKSMMESNEKHSKEMLTSTFKLLLPRILPRELAGLSEPQVEQYFMQGFAGASSSFTMASSFETALKYLLEERELLVKNMTERLASNRLLLITRISKRMDEENLSYKQFQLEYSQVRNELKTQELNRRTATLGYIQSYYKMSSRKWKILQRFLSSERGPWNSEVKKDEVIILKLEATETTSRMRKRMKRDYEGSQHNNSTVEAVKQKAAQKATFSLRSSITKRNTEDGTTNEKDMENIEKEEIVLEDIPKGTILLQLPCERVKPMELIPGTIELSSSHLYFTDSQNTSRLQWQLDDIVKLFGRRFTLKWTSIEIFTSNGRNYFFNFATQKEALRVFKKIYSIGQYILDSSFGSPEKTIAKSNITQLWVQRKISNFDYLMALNTYAGRTYNDLAQYPVFPWIISDYDSEKLDLSDPSIYRDLSKPIGALNPTRLQQFIERCNAFVDPEVPPFLYGSHYSSPGIILFYLLRVEPFTTHYLTLQGGYFDYAERLFVSLPTTWKNCMTAPSDMKELIPEFFYLPDMFKNNNNLDLGAKQDGTKISDVILPPWAKNDPELFVRINREALESDYVSERIHEWIDLIFGYKQTGKEAVAANNVFYFLSYEGAVDLDTLVDENEKNSKISHIQNFGQTPAQLFKKPHPKRIGYRELGVPKGLDSGIGTFILKPRPLASVPVILAKQIGSSIILIYYDGVVSTSHWSAQPDGRGLPFSLDLDRSPNTPKQKEVSLQLSPELYEDYERTPFCVGISGDGKTIIHTGSWDDSVKLSSMNSGQVVHSTFEHDDLVTCVDMAEDGKTLITGSDDTSVRVWDYEDRSRSLLVSPKKKSRFFQLKFSLFGHEQPITCISINSDANIIASASTDKTVNMYNIDGKFLRTIPFEQSITMIKVTKEGDIVTYSRGSSQLTVHDTNARLRVSVKLSEVLTYLLVSKDGKTLVTGDQYGTVNVRTVEELAILRQYEGISSPVRALNFIYEDDRELYILSGHQNGQIAIYFYDTLFN